MDQATQALKETYQRVMQTQDGLTVLTDIFNLLGFFSNQPDHITPECIAVGNTILSRCGVISSGSTAPYMAGLSYGIAQAQAQAEPAENEEDLNDV